MEFSPKPNILFKKQYKSLKKKYADNEEILKDLKELKRAHKNDILETINAIRYEYGDY